tara:strand:+ start:1234 stop:1482 length:249 start_codon:yes stop_codon:yes gene_type:complete
VDDNKIKFCVPIWMSDWVFEDKRKNKFTISDVIVKGHNRDEIISNPIIVNKVVRKINGKRKNKQLKPINLTLTKQHGYGVKE